MAVRFKPKPIDVPKDTPFEHDLLQREESAKALTQFVARLEEPFVLAVDSPWGSGKTTFLKMWLQSLQNKGFPCLYFNAWQNDFSESPLVSLIGEIGEAIEELRLGGEQEKTARRAFEKAKKSGAALAKAALPAALKLATAGLLDLTALKVEDLAKLAEEVAKQQIEKYQADKKTIVHFRFELAELVAALRKKSGASLKPIIFVVDELDRCRPPYAIELLEKIKHLFSVEGLVFVLAIDRQQLSESVKCLYGQGLDADNYLRRFIDLEYRLPVPKLEQFVKAQFARFDLEQAMTARKGRTSEDAENLVSVLTELFAIFGFHLRTQEHCFTQLALVLHTTPPTSFVYTFLLVPLLCLRIANRGLYDEYCGGRAIPADVVAFIRRLKGGNEFMDSRIGSVVKAHLIFGMRDYRAMRAENARIQELASDQKAEPALQKRAALVAECFQWIPWESAQDPTGYLHRKIELNQPFIEAEDIQ
jgi:hypothetical protein